MILSILRDKSTSDIKLSKVLIGALILGSLTLGGIAYKKKIKKQSTSYHKINPLSFPEEGRNIEDNNTHKSEQEKQGITKIKKEPEVKIIKIEEPKMIAEVREELKEIPVIEKPYTVIESKVTISTILGKKKSTSITGKQGQYIGGSISYNTFKDQLPDDGGPVPTHKN